MRGIWMSWFGRGHKSKGSRALTAIWLVALLAVPAEIVISDAVRGRELLPGPMPARMVQVIDGDTIGVRARIWLEQDVTIHARLAGIDATELGAACLAER